MKIVSENAVFSFAHLELGGDLKASLDFENEILLRIITRCRIYETIDNPPVKTTPKIGFDGL